MGSSAVRIRISERRALPRPGGPGDQEDARRPLDQLAQPAGDLRGEPELVDRLRRVALVQDPQHDALPVVAGQDRDAEIDVHLLAVALDPRAERAVLRPPLLRDVQLPQDLDARDDLAAVFVAHLLQRSEIEFLEHAIHPEADVQAPGEVLEVDVAHPPVDRQREELTDGRLRLLVLDVLLGVLALQREHLDLLIHLDEFARRRREVGIHRFVVQPLERPLDCLVRRGDDVHDVAGGPGEVVDERVIGGVVHRHGEHGADAADRDDQVTARVVAVDDARKGPLQVDPVEVQERDVQLDPQGLAHHLVGDEPHADQHLAQGLVPRLLFGERLFQSVGGERPVAEQDLAEPRPLVGPLEDQRQLLLGDASLFDEDLPERHVPLARALLLQGAIQLACGDEALVHEGLAQPHLGWCNHRVPYARSARAGTRPAPTV
jgi:hypothetical protein